MPTVSKNGVGATPVTNFSEEKKQKTFATLARRCRQLRDQAQKFFGSFFQKRTAFLLTLALMGLFPWTPAARLPWCAAGA
jgi:hypothetical protein